MLDIRKIIPINSNIQFMNLKNMMLIFSSFFMFLAIMLIIFKGLNLGIDFKGGTLIEISTKESNISELRKILNSKYDEVSLQEFGNSNTILIRLQNQSNLENAVIINDVKNLISEKVVEFRRSEFVGPTISSELLLQGLQAVGFAI